MTETTFGKLKPGELFYEYEAGDGIYMMKLQEASAGGVRFNCMTWNASPCDEVPEYVAFKADDYRVYRMKDNYEERRLVKVVRSGRTPEFFAGLFVKQFDVESLGKIMVERSDT